MRSSELSVGQVVGRSGVSISALHFYESRGLIHSTRNAGNQRRYRREVLRRIATIRIAQRIGLSLEDIQIALSGLPEARTPTREDWKRLSASWRRELDARIIQLNALRDQLTDCIGCGCLSLQRCSLSNPADVLATSGQGPRRWPEDSTMPKETQK